jgi:hypothetical protein
MPLLIDALTAAPTPVGSEDGGGFDAWKLLGIPAAVAAVLGLITTYSVGIIRPLAVRRARYWHAGQATLFSCVVHNRSFFGDRTVTALALVEVPGLLTRIFRPSWKRTPQLAELIPWGLPAALPTIAKRNQVVLEGELRKGNVAGRYDPAPRIRLLAHAGSRSSRSKRFTKVE